MTKKIVLKLKNIGYTGDSIGDKIKLEINILGKPFSVEKKIKVDTTLDFNKVVGEFDTDRKIFEAGIHLRIIEDDPVFNDVGILQETIEIDTAKNSQEFKYEIEVRERRINLSKATAVFRIFLQAEILEVERYLSETKDGWLLVDIENVKEKVSLPSFLNVNFIKSFNKRDYFNILEGFYAGKTASVKKKSDGSSYVQTGFLERSPLEVIYSLSKKSFILGDEEYSVDDDPNNLFSLGVYDIEIPYVPHDKGRPYLNKSRFALVWFHIGHDPRDDRFLHTGSVSAGCISMREIEKWNEACKKLLISRKDNISVGVLRVIK